MSLNKTRYVVWIKVLLHYHKRNQVLTRVCIKIALRILVVELSFHLCILVFKPVYFLWAKALFQVNTCFHFL